MEGAPWAMISMSGGPAETRTSWPRRTVGWTRWSKPVPPWPIRSTPTTARASSVSPEREYMAYEVWLFEQRENGPSRLLDIVVPPRDHNELDVRMLARKLEQDYAHEGVDVT